MDLGFRQKGFRPVLALDHSQAVVQTYNFNESRRVALKCNLSELAQGLEPRVKIELDSRIRRLAEYHTLELCSPKEDRFRRVYCGVHQRSSSHFGRRLRQEPAKAGTPSDTGHAFAGFGVPPLGGQ